jgi:basic amino acid/polyamine antiporter, APA family
MSEPQEFKRELGLWSSTMIVMGVMIGSGIFIVSADISRTVGSAGYLLLVWVCTGLMTLMAALSYGELAGMMPHAGGQYVYLREAYNPLTGFLYGWTLFLVIQTGTIAAVAVAFAKFLAVLLPDLGEGRILVTVFGKSVSAAQVVGMVSIVILTAINAAGLRQGKWVQNIFTVTKIGSLAALIIIGLVVGSKLNIFSLNMAEVWQAHWTTYSKGAIESVRPISGMMLLAAIGVAMVGSLFSSDAWNNITFTAAEVVRPKRTIPWSLALGTGAVTVLYVLANLAYISVLPVQGQPGATNVLARGIAFAVSDRVGTAAAWQCFGDPAVIIMAVLIVISTFGCNNGLILAGARVYYAMSRDGLFFRSTGRLNQNHVPGYALWVQAAWSCLLCLTGTYGELLDYVIFAVLVFYMLTIAGLFILRSKKPFAERPYRAFGYPIVPALYILCAGAICLDLLIFKPHFTWPGLIVVICGIPVYYVWRAWSGKSRNV